MPDWVINPGTSVQTTINNPAVVNGDRILLNPGAYINDNTLTINKQLAIMANVPGSFPNIRLNFTTFAYGLVFGASNIVLDGLDIDNTRGGVSNGYIRHSGAFTNTLIKNCKIHNVRRWFIGDSGLVDGFTFQDSEYYNFLYTGFEISNAKNILITRNKIYNQTNTSSGEGSVTWYLPADVGTSEISYNYVIGTRYGIAPQPATINSVSIGSLLIAHNTIDMSIQATYPSNVNVPYSARYASSFYTAGANKTNGANIIYRDNLITRNLVDMYLSATQVFLNTLEIKNCMFFNNFWYYWPTTGRSTFEMTSHINGKNKKHVPAFDSVYRRYNKINPGARHHRALMGMNQPDLANVKFVDCYVTDPFFELSGAAIQDFYALKPNSPARGAASDRTNIGAWQ